MSASVAHYPDPFPRPDRPAPGPDEPRSGDLRDRADLLKITVWFGPACFTMLSFLWYFMLEKQWIPGALFVILLVLNIPLTVAGIFLIDAATRRASKGLINAIYSAGDIPPPRSYPRQDLMITRGDLAGAVEAFRDHLVIEPQDNEARLRLADVLEALKDPAGAEALYKEVRARHPLPREAVAAANGLIDLYRRTGQVGRLRVELARFAEAYRGTAAAKGAARELAELKATSESPRSPT